MFDKRVLSHSSNIALNTLVTYILVGRPTIAEDKNSIDLFAV